MKKRVNIIATGRVQEVRYRSKVRDLAKKLGILGQVQNLPDGSVEIIAEGDENTLQDFIDKIRIKNRLIEVQNLEISYSEPTGEFETFKKIISGTPEEMADRLDAAADHLEKLIDVVLMLNENVKSGNKMLAEKIDSGNKMLAEVCNKL
ncbi:MAG: acylphosphatase, partial [Methanosarcinales archaeon]